MPVDAGQVDVGFEQAMKAHGSVDQAHHIGHGGLPEHALKAVQVIALCQFLIQFNFQYGMHCLIKQVALNGVVVVL